MTLTHPVHILAVADPTASHQPAVDKAARLAHRFGARLELFACEDTATVVTGIEDPPQQPLTALKAIRYDALEKLAGPLRQQGLDVSTDVVVEAPLHESIARKAARCRADLVVKDTHYHPLIRRTLITNTDWQLIRSCPAPLLLTKPTAWASWFRALAAVDPGHAADKPATLDHQILDWAQGVAAVMSGEAHAVHLYFPSTLVLAGVAAAGMPLTAAAAPSDQLIDQERKRRKQDLLALAAAHDLPPERTHMSLGAPVEALAGEAERLRADLVVMGAVSRSRMERIFVGSTAEKVLDRLPCDVLVIKPLDFTSDLPF